MKRVLLAWTVALAGCPTVDLGDTPPDIGNCVPAGGQGYFTGTLWPMYLHNPASSCGPSHNTSCDCARSNCHLAPGGASGLGFDPNDLQGDYITATQAVYLNCSTPTASPLLTKPLAGVDGHPIDMFTTSDPQYQTFLNWFK
jgi:hypothetical protein